MSYIVMLLGMSKAGKDEVGKFFIKNGYKRYAFADAVKIEYAKTNNLPLSEMFNEKKEFHRSGIIKHAEYKRVINKFHWINEIQNDLLFDYNNGIDIVITDSRRIPEILFIKALKELYGTNNVVLCEVIRPIENGGEFDEDPETSKAIQYANFHNLVDYKIYNDKPSEDLKITVEEIIKNLKLKEIC